MQRERGEKKAGEEGLGVIILLTWSQGRGVSKEEYRLSKKGG